MTRNEGHRRPVFSPDGTRLAFIRNVLTKSGAYEIVIVNADGSDLTVVATLPITFNGPPQVQWAPDGQALLVAEGGGELRIYDAEAGSNLRVVATGASVDREAFRPPDGDKLLFRRLDMSGSWVSTSRISVVPTSHRSSW